MGTGAANREGRAADTPRGAAPARLASVLLALAMTFAMVHVSAARAQSSDARAGETCASPVIVLDGPASVASLAGRVEVLFDDDASLTLDDVRRAPCDAFAPVEDETLNFGYTKSRIWLRATFRNATDDVIDWRMLTNEDFLQEFDAFLVRDDPGNGSGRKTQHLVDLDLDAPFSARPVPFSKLVVPMELPPGETATLYVRYWSGGLSTLYFSVESAESFAVRAAQRMSKEFAFYGVTGAFVLVALFALALMRSTVFLAYAAYTTSTLLYIMVAEGVAHQYIWPNLPRINDVAAVVVAAAMFISACAYARIFLSTSERHPLIDRVLLGLIVVTLLFIAAAFTVDRQLVKKHMILLAPAITVTLVFAGLVAARDRFREVRFFVLAWVGAAVSAILLAGRHWVDIDISRDVQFDVTRTWMVLDALFMGLAIADRINQQRLAAARATERSLADARRNIRLNERLRELEADYDRARENARQQGERIHDTVHDLRQPLNALRLSLRDLARAEDGRAPPLEAVEASFAYMEGLVADQLDGSAGATDERDGATDDTVDLGGILDAVGEMFAPEAAAKGVRLDVVSTGATTPVPSLVVMRSLSNLVSNAIKFAPSGGRVLVGVRRTGDRLRLEVHDTGPGLDAGQFALARERGRRLGNAGAVEGNGLGLSAVAALAARHGFDVRALTTGRACGASIALNLPSASADGAERNVPALEGAAWEGVPA